MVQGWVLLSCDSLGTKDDSISERFYTDNILFILKTLQKKMI